MNCKQIEHLCSQVQLIKLVNSSYGELFLSIFNLYRLEASLPESPFPVIPLNANTMSSPGWRISKND